LTSTYFNPCLTVFDPATTDGLVGQPGLVAVVGPSAYGTYEAGDDIRFTGFYSGTARQMLGLGPRPTGWSHDDEGTCYLEELSDFANSALAGDRSPIETLATPIVSLTTPVAELLRLNIDAFLTEGFLRDLLTYAEERMTQSTVQVRPDLELISATVAQDALRVLWQAQHLIETGTMRLQIPDRDFHASFAHWTRTQRSDWFTDQVAKAWAAPRALPSTADESRIGDIVFEHYFATVNDLGAGY